MNYKNFRSKIIVFILIFFITFVFFLIINTNVVLGDIYDHNSLVPGDFVFLENKTVLKNVMDNVHLAMYLGKYGPIHWFIEAGPGPVHRAPYIFLKMLWKDHYFKYVKTVSNDIRKQAAFETLYFLLHPYQYCFRPDYNNYDPWDIIPQWWLPNWFRVQFRCVPNFHCAELVWAGYMRATNPKLNIALGSVKTVYGKTGYNNAGLYQIIYNTQLIESFSPDNIPLSFDWTEIAVTVDGNLPVDDPQNNTWNTIQKGIDNLSSLDVLYLKNGIYLEDIVVNKSITIVGESSEDVIINGSMIASASLDYELPHDGETDPIANVNMTGNELLLQFNNDIIKGENYSSSNNVYDYSICKNNGTINYANWTTTTLKGNGSMDFNGINSFVNLTGIPALVGENVTISAWINWRGGSGFADPIVSQSNATHGYCIYVNSTTEKPVFRLDRDEVIASNNISNGWHHIVGTHDETMIKIFVDGVLSGSSSITGSGIDKDFYVGYDNISSYFNGMIDEVAIWNRTLSDDEISRMYQLNYGLVLINLTIKDGEIGITPCNNTYLCNCNIINHTVGIQIGNVSGLWIYSNISNCDTGIRIDNSNPERDNPNIIGICNITNCTSGSIINSSSNIVMFYNQFNCCNTNLSFNNCNLTSIYIANCTSDGNVGPDEPSLSGPTFGEIGKPYTYYSVTNDSDNEQLFYQFYWGDGNTTGVVGPYSSNETVNASHIWEKHGGYYIYVIAKDLLFNESWSEFIIFKTEMLSPLINSVDNSPDVVGFGGNVTITANVTDDNSGNYSGIQCVWVNISYPDNTSGSFTMIDIGNNTFEYVFSDTWLVGEYNYSIWAMDNAYNINSSLGYSFNVSAEGTVSLCTIKDEYGNNEMVNITDPPGDPPGIGYELLDGGKVLRIWNSFDSYYFNTTSGIQLTNHYNEYWSHNVLMLGYYNNDQWNLIYRTDELSGFNKNIESDNETFANATLWKDLIYQGYIFRLAVRYHLGVDDKELTVMPYIKNLGQAIPYTLGFAWEINDIQVDMTPSGDYIEINGTTYYLNQSLDETYKNLGQSCFYIREDISSDRSDSLYLCWNDSLDYLVKVKSREGQYNAPVTLGIKIGTLAAGQEKYTSLLWHDASEITYYFNSYNTGEKWTTNPSYMVDGSTSTYASTTTNGKVELCNGNNCSGSDLGNIVLVELRVYGYYSGTQRDIILRPVFSGTIDGLNHYYSTGSSPAWSRWFDITTDPYASPPWSWTKVKNLDCDVEAKSDIGFFTLYCSKVEIRVTYIPNSNPVISNPYPADGSTDISIAPVLNITVSDPDGNNMNIMWLSNSSGSWQVFGTNNSVSNGTYHQTMSNASTNGKWWYWKVNVTDGMSYNESSVYKFYTGYESKINNTGTTDIKGYLLIQVQYYNVTSQSWVVADDTVNETTPRTINSGGHLGLDTVFNGLVNTQDLSEYGNGTYRVYACFRDPDGNVLVCDDDSLMEATYEFTINI